MKRKEILVQLKQQTVFINPDTVMCIIAEGSYCVACLSDGRKIRISKNLKAVAALLQSYILLERVHRSHMVNRAFIYSVLSVNNGGGKSVKKVALKDGTLLTANKQFIKRVTDQRKMQGGLSVAQ